MTVTARLPCKGSACARRKAREARRARARRRQGPTTTWDLYARRRDKGRPTACGSCMSIVAEAAPDHAPAAPLSLRTFLVLALASTGVVYGDIGTSPLYALKESIHHLRDASGGAAARDVIGVVSLMFWALMVIVTVKYVLILMRFDNRGEGGNLSLMALVQRNGGRGAGLVLLVGMLGAGLFFGDAMLTPAISVLSAV